MQWVILHFAFALAVVISIIALIIGELHIVERAEQEKIWERYREKIANMR